MSSTVIRIKRPLTQEPAEALVLASKRARIEKTDGDDVVGGNLAAALGDETQKPTNVFKFCGTLKDEVYFVLKKINFQFINNLL